MAQKTKVSLQAEKRTQHSTRSRRPTRLKKPDALRFTSYSTGRPAIAAQHLIDFIDQRFDDKSLDAYKLQFAAHPCCSRY